jgi:hypothetical protein
MSDTPSQPEPEFSARGFITWHKMWVLRDHGR